MNNFQQLKTRMKILHVKKFIFGKGFAAGDHVKNWTVLFGIKIMTVQKGRFKFEIQLEN